MTAGFVEHGPDGSSPPREAAPPAGPAARAQQPLPSPVPDVSEVPGFPRQTRSDSDDADDGEAAQLLRKQVQEELQQYWEAMKGKIRGAGYTEPDLSEIHQLVNVRYYRARMTPGFAFTADTPWPFMLSCYAFASADFLRNRGLKGGLEVPTQEPLEPEDAAGRTSGPDGVDRREAIKALLAAYLPDRQELEIYLLTHMAGLGPVAIAERLRIDRKTVTKRLKKAEARMRSVPGDELDELR
ncbi:hypothetical protein ACFVVU_36075 [Kitasatospora sp. NPDC057965]|uniref:hypothetical protein n=1 Tax=Kitasatospora sp. NPDC057965 TaxID=3346291 RepID=UPI0036DCDE1E